MGNCRVETSVVKVLVLEGNLTVENAGSLKMDLMSSLQSAEHVVFNLAGVTGADLTCLQLLCSAHRIAAMLNKSLALNGKSPEAFKRAVEDIGFSRHTCCVRDLDTGCLFLE